MIENSEKEIFKYNSKQAELDATKKRVEQHKQIIKNEIAIDNQKIKDKVEKC